MRFLLVTFLLLVLGGTWYIESRIVEAEKEHAEIKADMAVLREKANKLAQDIQALGVGTMELQASYSWVRDALRLDH